MTSISPTFNAFARQHNLLILLWFWISFSLDSEEREDKKQRRRISQQNEQQVKAVVRPVQFAPTP